MRKTSPRPHSLQSAARGAIEGVLVNFYYGNSEAEIRASIAAGVDYILTDDLGFCLRILGEYGVKPFGQ